MCDIRDNQVYYFITVHHPFENSGNYMYHLLQKSIILFCTQCIYRFHMILRVSSDYFLKQHSKTDPWNGFGLRFIWGTDWSLNIINSSLIIWYQIAISITEGPVHRRSHRLIPYSGPNREPEETKMKCMKKLATYMTLCKLDEQQT
jgi:hypothetical protein